MTARKGTITTGSPPQDARSGPPGQEDRPADAPRSAYVVAPKVAQGPGLRAPLPWSEETPRAVRKAVRVRKARRRGACPVCRRLVLVGDLIASIGGAPFMCASHVTRDDTG